MAAELGEKPFLQVEDNPHFLAGSLLCDRPKAENHFSEFYFWIHPREKSRSSQSGNLY